jgi:hypothetical protein
MGLLDDAIREHLELKRLRGADPGAVARAEQDALGPVSRHEDAVHTSQVDDDESDLSLHHDEDFLVGSQPDPGTDSTRVGQETVEINMDAELGVHTDLSHRPESDPLDSKTPAIDASGSTDESLEWETPNDHADMRELGTVAEDKGGSPADHPHDDAEPIEDVLDEIPDFLRETPEQERLWFEQRPPRDFDFNE